MQCIIVDPDKNACESLLQLCWQIPGLEIKAVFNNALDAIDFIRENKPELAFIEWAMPEMNGMAFSKIVRSFYPEINLVIISASEKHALEAFNADARGYITKPADKVKLLSCIQRFQKDVQPVSKDIYVQTFGHFDVYVDGVAMVFRNSRAKEMLAMLVDRRGGMITVERFIEALWPDEPYSEKHKAIYRKAFAALKNSLDEYGISDVLVSSRNQKAIIASKVRCDYYNFLDGIESANDLYTGEYMRDYSWAENTNSKLLQIAEKREGSLLYQYPITAISGKASGSD